MSTMSRRSFGWMAFGALATATLPALAQQAPAAPAGGNRAVFQVTDNDPARWNMILNNMQNLREGMGSEPIEIELVAFGPGVNMMKSDSVVKDRIADAVKAGVKVDLCQNSMRGMKLTPADMVPQASYVPAGVVEVFRKQQQGWTYIRS